MKIIGIFLMVMISVVSFGEVHALKEKKIDKKKSQEYMEITDVLVTTEGKEFSLLFNNNDKDEFIILLNVIKLSQTDDTEVLNFPRKNTLYIKVGDEIVKTIKLGDKKKGKKLNERIKSVSFKNREAREEIVEELKKYQKVNIDLTMESVKFIIKEIELNDFSDYIDNKEKKYL